VLGLSVDAIRKRVQRGTIPYEKDPAGRVTILLDTVETVKDITGHGQGAERLLEDLRDQVAFLRRELEAERNAHAETRRITYTLAQRIPELEAPGEERDATETASPRSSDGGTPPGGSEETTERRSWLYRFFFGP
jgi:hypothetical protein